MSFVEPGIIIVVFGTMAVVFGLQERSEWHRMEAWADAVALMAIATIPARTTTCDVLITASPFPKSVGRYYKRVVASAQIMHTVEA